MKGRIGLGGEVDKSRGALSSDLHSHTYPISPKSGDAAPNQPAGSSGTEGWAPPVSAGNGEWNPPARVFWGGHIGRGLAGCPVTTGLYQAKACLAGQGAGKEDAWQRNSARGIRRMSSQGCIRCRAPVRQGGEAPSVAICEAKRRKQGASKDGMSLERSGFGGPGLALERLPCIQPSPSCHPMLPDHPDVAAGWSVPAYVRIRGHRHHRSHLSVISPSRRNAAHARVPFLVVFLFHAHTLSRSWPVPSNFPPS